MDKEQIELRVDCACGVGHVMFRPLPGENVYSGGTQQCPHCGKIISVDLYLSLVTHGGRKE